MSTVESLENEELAKTQGQFESEDSNGAELENIGETKEAAESAPGLEEMGESANQDISQALESAQVDIGNGIDLISRNEGAASEDVGEATAMGENISAQNEQDAQEIRQEIKSAIDLAKESAQGQMTELEKKWANENGESKIPEQGSGNVVPEKPQEIKQEPTVSEKTEEMPKREDVKEEDKNVPVKRFIKISPNILGKDTPIQVEKNEPAVAQGSEKRYVKISPNILGKDTPIDLSERGEAAMPEASKQEDIKEEEDKYKPRNSKFIKISKDILGKESPIGDNQEKISQEAMEQAKDAFEKIPDDEKPGLLKGLAGLGFKTQEWKGKIFKTIFNEMAKKSADWTEKGEQNIITRLCSSYADIYNGVEDQAKTKQDELYNQKGGAWNTVAGIGALAGNTLLYGRMIADATHVNPMRNVTAGAMFLGRGGEAMKEAHLKSHEVIAEGRVQDENEAYDQAMELYGQAKEKSPAGIVGAENLSKLYKENLPKDLLNRLDKEQGKDGICSRIAQKIAKTDIEFSLKRIDKKIKSVESDDNLSPGDKAAAKSKILKKYEKFLNDMDRIVANSGKTDLISYGSRLTEKGGKAAASFMALETLAEGIAHGEAALAALVAGESDSSPELPFQNDSIELDQADTSLEDQIIADSAPDEISAEAFEPAEQMPEEDLVGEIDTPAEDFSAEKSAAFAKDLHEGGVLSDEELARTNARILENSGVEAEDLNKLNAEDLKNLTPEQIGQIDDYNSKIEALKNAGVSQEDLDKFTDEEIRGFSDEQIEKIAEENIDSNIASEAIPATEDIDAAPETDADGGENEIISDNKATASAYSSESNSYGRASDIQNPDTIVSESNDIGSGDAEQITESKETFSVADIFGRKYVNMENLRDIAVEKGMSEQILRNEATDAGSEINRYVDTYKSLISSEGKSGKTDGMLKKITEITNRYESKYGSGFLDKASILENLKK